ncbi:MAG: hypothetical protein V7676_16975 [Parasphingorhabdus sp.]|jgi:hypothetical protein|uniref:hypothetical protein n=1 Tax=Parasphingorhabdus sp. TaxID=2709688 RepID=UPI003002BA60
MKSRAIYRIFHEVLIDCMAHARPPTTEEIEVMAARIWDDMRGEKPLPPWHEVVPGSLTHNRMARAARVALGLITADSAQDRSGLISR